MARDDVYRKLLIRYAPGPIRSAKEYRRALGQLEELMVPHPDAAHSLLIELISTLVEDYESREELPPCVVSPRSLRDPLR